jgi:2-keto-4-pentenoate hydratase/2-oxohepta-3-ene-1,7-dioic acid hydratase in catechol pathway
VAAWARFLSAEGREGFGRLAAGHLEEYEGDLFGAARPSGRALEPGSFALLSPCAPGKLLALWNNFHALAAKLGKQPPRHPLYLIKASSCVVGPDAAIKRPEGYGGKIAFEGELGIVIGRACERVATADAHRYIFGYTCVNDVTASDVLSENPDFPQWTRCKSFDTFGCLGPVIATDFDWAAAHVVTLVDGVERQNYPLADMIFTPDELVSRLSHDMRLLPGDVIACGTSLGLGSLKAGSRVEIRIAGVGTLANVLAADAA